MPEANDAALFAFPANRIVRHQLPPALTNHVVVTHQGMSQTYDCPQDLHAAVLVANRHLLVRAEKGRALRRIRRHARCVRRVQRLALRRLNKGLEAIAVTAIGLAILAWGFGL